MLNRVMAWIQSKRIIISSLVIAFVCPSSVSGSFSINHHVITLANLIHNQLEMQILGILVTWLFLWILFHICQWIFSLIRQA